MTSKRERYERSNMRGGMGVRKRLSDESLRQTYRLNGVQTGSVVVRAHDKYFADFTKGFDVGILVRKTSSIATIHWYGDEEATHYSQGDARYEVDRGRWRFLGIIQGNPLDPDNPLADALTALRRNAIMDVGNMPTPPTEETEELDMAKEQSNAAAERADAQRALKNGDFKERETYTAKQVAGRCGTDSKTMRKFFRSNHSTVEPVGQGGRYEFDAKDFPKIKREFDTWQTKAKARTTTPKPANGRKIEKVVDEMATAIQQSVDEDSDIEAMASKFGSQPEDYLEPTAEELAELEGLELDLDELDAEDD